MEKESFVPDNYNSVMPYLILKNVSGFIAFTGKVFNSRQTLKVMRDENTVMHAEITIGDSLIMCADSTDQYETQTASLFIYVEDADATYYQALENDATVVTGMANQSYGRSGGVKDPFGNTWWITSTIK